eukprot:1558616-Amphidinium_carterae.1
MDGLGVKWFVNNRLCKNKGQVTKTLQSLPSPSADPLRARPMCNAKSNNLMLWHVHHFKERHPHVHQQDARCPSIPCQTG